jgi:hypothetical protein
MSADHPTVALYECADGRWIHLHGAFPHLRRATLGVLDCGDDPAAIARRVATWRSHELEQTLADAGTCGAVAREASEWETESQGEVVRRLGPVAIEKVADSPPIPVQSDVSPLDGARVLDMTRILAGPTCGRLLAEYGADVLSITSSGLEDYYNAVVDTGRGKRSAHVDLAAEPEGGVAAQLVARSDVFIQSYRAGSLDKFGYGPAATCDRERGIVYVSINCYGAEGPWAGRRGWEQLAQTASGLVFDELANGVPATLPVTVCDYVTGYLATLGTLEALLRRAEEGGSYHVRASLAQTATWLTGLGPTGKRRTPVTAELLEAFSEHLEPTDSPLGRLEYLRSPLELSRTPATLYAPMTPGAAIPAWKRPSPGWRAAAFET